MIVRLALKTQEVIITLQEVKRTPQELIISHQ